MTAEIKYWKELSYVYQSTNSALHLRIHELKLKFEREIHNDIKERIEREIKDCRNAISHNERTLKRINLQIVALEKIT